MRFKRLEHIAIKTDNMEETITFYTKLGATLKAREELPNTALALMDLCDFELEFIQNSLSVNRIEGSIPHIALEVEDIDECIKELKSMGIVFRTEDKKTMPIFGGIENIFFEGPSKEVIELLQHKKA